MALESIAVCLIETYKERSAAHARQRAARKRYLVRHRATVCFEGAASWFHCAACRCDRLPAQMLALELSRFTPMPQARYKALQSLEREEAAREAAAAAAPAPPELAANGSSGNGFAASAGLEGAAGAGANGHQAARPHRHASLFKVGSCRVGWLASVRPAGPTHQHPPLPHTCALSSTLRGAHRPQTVTMAPSLATMREVLADDESYCQWLAAQVDMWSAISLFILYNVAIILIYTLQSGYVDLLVGWEGPPPPEWQ